MSNGHWVEMACPICGVGEKERCIDTMGHTHPSSHPQRRVWSTHAKLITEAKSIVKEECEKRLDAECVLQKLINTIDKLYIPPQGENLKHGASLRAALTDANRVLEAINDEGPVPELEIERSSRKLKLALALAFAPRIDDKEAMRFCRALQRGESEGSMGLTTVPIDIVYSAMFNFTKEMS